MAAAKAKLKPGASQGKSDAPLTYVSTEPEVRELEAHLRRLTRAIKEGTASPEMASLESAGAGFTIPIVEVAFRTGKKVRQGQRNGHEGTHGTLEQKRARWGEYQRLVNEKVRANPYLSFWRACVLVAKDKGCVPVTVMRHTADPREAAKK